MTTTNPQKRSSSKAERANTSFGGQSPITRDEKNAGKDPLFDDFEEDDPLVCENRSITKDDSNYDSFALPSERPESESQLSIRHLSESGKKMRTSNYQESQTNMLNMYIGIALVAAPKAFSEVGFVAGILGLVFVNIISLGASYFLLKARNRFKKTRIVDFADLGAACYGPRMKLFCQTVLLLASASFLMAQGMYLGGQADLLVCDVLDRPTECGKNKKMYSFVMVALLSPILLLPDFKKLSIFSSIFISCCFISVIAIFIFEFNAIYNRMNGIEQEMTFSDEFGGVSVATAEQKEEAYDFDYFNFAHFPLFLGEILAIFEGNAGILNIYSQHSEPREMFRNTIMTHITVGALVISLCAVSYLAYGSMVQDIVLYNMPQHSNLARIVELMYMLNIVGSFTICIQPIYSIFERKVEKKEKAEEDPESSRIQGNASFTQQAQEQQDQSLGMAFYVRRLSIPFAIMVVSCMFPDVNTILSLVAGSICGVLLIVLPIFFYRAAYIEKPSKKNRTCTVCMGYLLVACTLPLGILGVYSNLKIMAGTGEGGEVVDPEFASVGAS